MVRIYSIMFTILTAIIYNFNISSLLILSPSFNTKFETISSPHNEKHSTLNVLRYHSNNSSQHANTRQKHILYFTSSDKETSKTVTLTNRIFSTFLQIVLSIICGYFIPKHIKSFTILIILSTSVNAQSFAPTKAPTTKNITDSYFDCGALKCANRNVYCADNEDCYVRCEARWACSNTNIYCPSNEYNCTVYCRWQRACSQANIFGGGGDLMVESDASNTGGTNGKEIFYQTEINCPIQHQCIVESFGHPYDQSCVINGLSASILNISITGYARSWTVNCPKQSECNIICGGHGAGCDSFNMNAQNSSKLNVQVSSTDPSSSMTIRCPIDNIRGNSNNCNIFGDNPTMNDLMQNMKIYAVEGVNDFILSCFGPCFTSTATLFCTEHFGSSCSITSDDHSVNNWGCINNASICNNYEMITYSPTSQTTIPTTYSPSAETVSPSNIPTTIPTIMPTTTLSPTNVPTISTSLPTTAIPSTIPTTSPTESTNIPTTIPTYYPTLPSMTPTLNEIDRNCFNNSYYSVAAWYVGSSVELNELEWKDISGNNRHASIDNIGGAKWFNGSDNNNEFYSNGNSVFIGDNSTTITFNGGLELSETHTIFSVCKYQNIGTKNRIIQTESYDGIFGFNEGKSGVAMENGIWITDNMDRFSNDWVLSTQTPQLYRAWATDYTQSYDGSAINSKLMINKGFGAALASHFGCSEIILFEQMLDMFAIECIEKYLYTKYPSSYLTLNPTSNPSLIPTSIPTSTPTMVTQYPSKSPTIMTFNPSKSPTILSSTIIPSITTISPTFIPTITPSKSPSNEPTVLTSNPTTSPTYLFKPLRFAYNYSNTSNNDTFPVLYLDNFKPISLNKRIDFIYYDINKKPSVIFLDCIPFNTVINDEEKNRKFEQITNGTMITNQYQHAIDHMDIILQCNKEFVCYMECESLCIGSTFISNAKSKTLIECINKFSCLYARMKILH
eukprot:423216_1